MVIILVVAQISHLAHLVFAHLHQGIENHVGAGHHFFSRFAPLPLGGDILVEVFQVGLRSGAHLVKLAPDAPGRLGGGEALRDLLHPPDVRPD